MNELDFECIRLMLEFCERVQRRIKGVDLDTFLDNEDLQDSVLYAVGQIGENANKVSESARELYHDILWNQIIGIRHRVFHSYGNVDMSIIYEVVVEHMPKLAKQLRRII